MQIYACTGRADPMEDFDSVYKVRSDCEDVASSSSPSSLRRRRRRLAAKKWHAAFNSQGQINFRNILHHIEKGGLNSSIRAEVWEYLLGAYSPNSNAEERNAIRQSRRDKYFKLKAECRAMDSAVGSGDVVITPRINEDGSLIDHRQDLASKDTGVYNGRVAGPTGVKGNHEIENGVVDPKVATKVIQWKLILHQIGLDVVRTDRMLEFYEDPKNLGKLWDILAIYAWIDEEVGYCQGMSDLCSPMVVLFPDEADAFWCFKCLMNRVRENFRCTDKTMGVQKQLSFLASAMQVIDPKLHKYLEAVGGGTYIFAFRMLMVVFRREFSFADTLYLWEMMWAFEYHPDLQYLNLEVEATRLVSTEPDYRAGGRFAKRNIKYGSPKTLNENPSLAVFFVAGILEMLRTRLLKRTQGLDEVVKALNDMTGKIDPHRACEKALKYHKLYLKKVKKVQ